MLVKMRRQKQYTPAERAGILRRADLLIDAGASVATAAMKLGMRYGTLSLWRRRYAGLAANGADHLRRLEMENLHLRRALLALDAPDAIRRVAPESQLQRRRQWLS